MHYDTRKTANQKLLEYQHDLSLSRCLASFWFTSKERRWVGIQCFFKKEEGNAARFSSLKVPAYSAGARMSRDQPLNNPTRFNYAFYCVQELHFLLWVPLFRYERCVLFTFLFLFSPTLSFVDPAVSIHFLPFCFSVGFLLELQYRFYLTYSFMVPIQSSNTFCYNFSFLAFLFCLFSVSVLILAFSLLLSFKYNSLFLVHIDSGGFKFSFKCVDFLVFVSCIIIRHLDRWKYICQNIMLTYIIRPIILVCSNVPFLILP